MQHVIDVTRDRAKWKQGSFKIRYYLKLTLLVTLLIALLMLLDILVSSDFQNRKSAIDTFNKVQNIVTTIGKRTN